MLAANQTINSHMPSSDLSISMGGRGAGEHFNPHFEYLRLNCQGYSRSEYQAGMLGGEGAVSMKHEA